MATKKLPAKKVAKAEHGAETLKPYICYQLEGVTYLPHFHERLFVKPGYGKEHWETYIAAELLAKGAKPVELMLWNRARF